MIFVVTAACIDCKDGTCAAICPVDCIYEGSRMFYIHPEECIGCGACESVCPVEAIWRQDIVPERLSAFVEENSRFFAESGLGDAGGASSTGAVDYDTDLVASWPDAQSGMA